MSDERMAWNSKLAAQLIGKRVLIGVVEQGPDGPIQEQMFGIVVSADPKVGFSIELEGTRSGDYYQLPPDLDAFHPASPGEYRLRTTGKVVVDPDFTSTWNIERPTA